MAQERPKRFVEWLTILRQRWPMVRQQAVEWWSQVREEPRLLGEAPVVRYAAYGLGGLIAVWTLQTIVQTITPPPPASAQARTTTADYYVVCTSPACAEHFIVHRAFGFDGFPVKCPKCGGKTGFSARPCASAECQGRWVVPQEVDGVRQCPHCGSRLN
ncbi:MAG: hypothetical protein AABZ12_02750 [Planctomycetota bacterium]